MNPEYQILYVLSAIAASTAFAKVTTQSKTGLIDWIMLGSLMLVLIQITSLCIER